MRSIYFGLAAAVCWTGALGASLAQGEGSADMAAVVGRRRLPVNGGRRYASTNFASLGVRQANPQCGSGVGRCPGDLCCSSYGFCGDSVDHCHPLFDCQPQYGTCGWPRVVQTTTSSTSTSTTSTSRTTSTASTTSTTSTTSLITSQTTSSTTTRQTSTSTTTVVIPTGSLQVTTNGMCGNNTMCIGNPNYGPCCSQFFWCGSTMEFCGAGCRSEFGACLGVPGIPGGPAGNVTTTAGGPTTTTSSTTRITTSTTSTTSSTSTIRTTSSTTTSSGPSFTLPAGQRSSTDGRCGNNVNCLGSTFGRCCSQFGFCGDGDQFCPYIVGCQPEFGYCDPQ